MNDIAIKFNDVSKEYVLFKNDKQRFKALFFSNERLTKVTAVNHLSFEIKKGEAIALLGRNGCAMLCFTDLGLAAEFAAAMSVTDPDWTDTAELLSSRRHKAARRKAAPRKNKRDKGGEKNGA